MTEKAHFFTLLDRYILGEISYEECIHLGEFLREQEYIDLLDKHMKRRFENEAQLERSVFPGDQQLRLLEERLDIQLVSHNRESNVETIQRTHHVHFLGTTWFRWAAILIVLIGAGTFTFLFTSRSNLEVAQITRLPMITDVMPGTNKAVLTLSNGQQIQLSNATSETILDGNLSIKNNNGQLNYHGGNTGANADVIAINTTTTPKGGQYQLSLADGTKVWLNAASSITFPTRFTGSKREVSITGEVYFEVSKNKGKPFIVKSSTDEITVLGTAFNVNSYSDETDTKTTLIEGAVKIGEHLLKPGQAYTNGKIISTNIEQDVAWKNGIFNFQNLSFQEAAKQLERWYDIKIIYESSIPNIRFQGDMDRGINLSGIIRLLSAFGIKARIEDRKLIVE
jgi:transmembrane sensor